MSFSGYMSYFFWKNVQKYALKKKAVDFYFPPSIIRFDNKL